jgi:hypothetical protein
VPENPLTRPPEWRIGFVTKEVPLIKSKPYTTIVPATLPATGFITTNFPAKDVLNAAGFPFDPPVMVEESYPQAVVAVNSATINLPRFYALQDCCNSKKWYGLEPLTARIVGLEATSQYDNGTQYWKLTYTIGMNWDTWIRQVFNAGFIEHRQYYNDELERWEHIEYVNIVDKHGREPSVPWPLDKQGMKFPPPTPGVAPVYEYLPFMPYRTLDFKNYIV